MELGEIKEESERGEAVAGIPSHASSGQGRRNSKLGRFFSKSVSTPSASAQPENKAQGPRIVALKPLASASDVSAVSYCPLVQMKVMVEVHLAMAFVRVTGTWRKTNDMGRDTAFVFELPTSHKTSVMSATVSLDNGVVFDTVIVEATPALGNYRQKEGRGMAKAMKMYRERCGRSVSEYDPEMFTLPFHGSSWSKADITVDFLLPANYKSSGYEIRIPMKLESESLTRPVAETLDLKAKINSGTELVRWRCDSHPMVEVDASIGEKTFKSLFTKFRNNLSKNFSGNFSGSMDYEEVQNVAALQTKFIQLKKDGGGRGISNNDVVISYAPLLKQTQSMNSILCTALYNSDTMCAFIMPPNVRPAGSRAHPRSIVFLLDRSGSMGFTGVMDAANKALCVGLDQLQPGDKFAICAYDHRQYWFAASEGVINENLTPGALKVQVYEGLPNCGGKGALAEASRTNVKIAKEWVSKIEAGGLTDILTPIQQSMVLMGADDQGGLADGSLPMVFLVTDGAVENERGICKYVSARAPSCRYFTFGIGSCCNAYFLRLLSSIGRGYCDVSLTPQGLERQMVELFRHASEPVLIDIAIKIPDSLAVTDLEFCPLGVPDMYRGGPVVCCIKFKGKISSSKSKRPYLVVEGKTPRRIGSQDWSEKVELVHSPKIPLRKVFAKQQLEQLIAAAWLEDYNTSKGKQLRKKAVDLATAESIPSPFTQMIAFETNAEDDRAVRLPSRNLDPDKVKNGVIFVGAAVAGAAAFGSVAATLANIASTGAEVAEIGEACECCEIFECCECCEM